MAIAVVVSSLWLMTSWFQMVGLVDFRSHLKSRPFAIQSLFYCLKSWLVWISDAHCIHGRVCSNNLNTRLDESGIQVFSIQMVTVHRILSLINLRLCPLAEVSTCSWVCFGPVQLWLWDSPSICRERSGPLDDQITWDGIQNTVTESSWIILNFSYFVKPKTGGEIHLAKTIIIAFRW